MNNGIFKALGTKTTRDYTGGIKVYLESTDDQFIFKNKWFSRFNDKISFESVSPTKGNGGCQKVISNVKENSEAY